MVHTASDESMGSNSPRTSGTRPGDGVHYAMHGIAHLRNLAITG
ncbi:hypothetical protein AB0C11_39985 [Streptomyces sp. NPDC039016]